MKTRFITYIVMLIIITLPFVGQAQIPRTLSYQGVLSDDTGSPKSDGSYSFTFSLYNTSAGGAAIWAETKTLDVSRGLFYTVLGDAEPFGAAVEFDEPYWLGIQVDAEPELSPRIPLTSVGYSFNSLRADTAAFALSVAGGAGDGHSLDADDGDPTDAVYVDGDGNVGIGTVTPGEKLDVAGNVHADSFIAGSTTTYTDGAITMSGPTTSLAITGGNVGIGTTSPTVRTEILHSDLNSGASVLRLTNEGDGVNSFTETGIAFNVGLGNNPNFYAARIYSKYDGVNVYDGRLSMQVRDGTGNFRDVLNIKGDNVGIGTSSPGAKLEVAGQVKITGGSPGTNKVLTSDATGLATWVTPSGGGGGQWTDAGTYINANNAANVVVTDAGNVGIGTASPSQRLEVNGNIQVTEGDIQLAKFANFSSIGTSNNQDLVLKSNSTERIRITNFGAVGIGTGSPGAGNKLTVAGNVNIGFGGFNTAPTNGLLVAGNVGIGTTSPGAKLEVAGQVKITGGSPGAGKVLTSNVDGLASWLTPSGGVGGSSIEDADSDTKVQTEASADEDKIRFDTNGFERMIIDNNGNVGIGMTNPGYLLHVNGSSRIENDLVIGAGDIKLSSDRYVGTQSTNLQIKFTDYEMLFLTNPTWGVSGIERMRIDKDGNVGIGTTTQFGSGEGILSFGNASINPSATLINAAALYASGGELFAYDAAGNATQISPHDKETGEWIFYSKNTKTGRVVRINMEKLVKKVEELTGESFMEEWIEE